MASTSVLLQDETSTPARVIIINALPSNVMWFITFKSSPTLPNSFRVRSAVEILVDSDIYWSCDFCLCFSIHLAYSQNRKEVPSKQVFFEMFTRWGLFSLWTTIIPPCSCRDITEKMKHKNNLKTVEALRNMSIQHEQQRGLAISDSVTQSYMTPGKDIGMTLIRIGEKPHRGKKEESRFTIKYYLNKLHTVPLTD